MLFYEFLWLLIIKFGLKITARFTRSAGGPIRVVFKAVKIDASYLSQMTMYILIGVNDHQKTICMSGISKILAPFELTHFFPKILFMVKFSIGELMCMYRG